MGSLIDGLVNGRHGIILLLRHADLEVEALALHKLVELSVQLVLVNGHVIDEAGALTLQRRPRISTDDFFFIVTVAFSVEVFLEAVALMVSHLRVLLASASVRSLLCGFLLLIQRAQVDVDVARGEGLGQARVRGGHRLEFVRRLHLIVLIFDSQQGLRRRAAEVHVTPEDGCV